MLTEMILAIFVDNSKEHELTYEAVLASSWYLRVSLPRYPKHIFLALVSCFRAEWLSQIVQNTAYNIPEVSQKTLL